MVRIRRRIVLRDIGTILKFISFAFAVPAIAAGAFAEWMAGGVFVATGIVLFLVSLSLETWFKPQPEARLHESMVTVAIAWLLAAFIGGIPLLFYGYSMLDATFEAMSAWTTTGLSVVKVEELPQSLLLWRSLMQWIGGLGIVVFALRGVFRTSSSLYAAEARDEKLRPSILGSGRTMWGIYAGYTAVGVVGLLASGMSFFDALNHTMTAIATGGMSTRAAGIAAFDSFAVEVVLMALMVTGAISFLTHYNVLVRRRLWFRDAQALLLLTLIAAGTGLAALSVPLRQALFHATSAITGTGFQTAVLAQWPAVPLVILVGLMVVGGSAGSTAGGIKLIRVLAFFKAILWQVRQLAQPHLVIVRKIGAVTFTRREITAAALFIGMYLITLAVSVFLLMLSGYSSRDGLFQVASAMGNVGLATREITGIAPKVVLIFDMWIGRLEFWAALVLVYNVISLNLFKRPHKT